MLVPAMRASTAWLPTVIVDGVVVLIKKGIRYLVDRNNERTPASLVRQPREVNSILFVFVSNRRTRSTTATRVRVFNTRVIDKVWYRGEEQPEREGREGVRDKRHYARPADRYDVRELSNAQQRCCCCLLCQNVEMVYTAVALRTLRIADVMSLPRGGGLASERFAPAPAALQSL